MKVDPIHESQKVQYHLDRETLNRLDDHFTDNNLEIQNTTDLKKLYPLVRPLLSWTESFLHFKPEWQSAIGILINSMDAEYGTKPAKKGAGKSDTAIPGLNEN